MIIILTDLQGLGNDVINSITELSLELISEMRAELYK